MESSKSMFIPIKEPIKQMKIRNQVIEMKGVKNIIHMLLAQEEIKRENIQCLLPNKRMNSIVHLEKVIHQETPMF